MILNYDFGSQISPILIFLSSALGFLLSEPTFNVLMAT